MRWRDQLALTLPAFLLRLALAITFLWAGVGKIAGTAQVQGDDAARLANLRVPMVDAAPQAPAPDTPEAPVSPPPEDPRVETPDAAEDASDDTPAPGDDDPDEGADQNNGDTEADAPPPMLGRRGGVTVHRVAQAASTPAVANDFPDPMEIKRVHTVTLILDKAVDPGLTDDSQPKAPLLPSWLGSGRMPVYAAWAAAVTEVLAGAFLLVGVLTRLSALATFGVMLMAMWTTMIGPAAMHSDDAILGFIPGADDPWAPSAYATLLWQLAVLAMSLAVVLLGPGPLSIDRLLFKPRRDPYETAEPTTSPSRGVPEGAPDPNP